MHDAAASSRISRVPPRCLLRAIREVRDDPLLFLGGRSSRDNSVKTCFSFEATRKRRQFRLHGGEGRCGAEPRVNEARMAKVNLGGNGEAPFFRKSIRLKPGDASTDLAFVQSRKLASAEARSVEANASYNATT